MITRSITAWILALSVILSLAAANAETHSIPPETVETSSKMKNGFSWVITNQLCGMPLPGNGGSLPDDLHFLQSKKIDLLVSLTEEALPKANLKEYGIESLHIPVPDYHAPRMEQLSDFVSVVNERIGNNQRVGIHCHAGHGRTGTFLAAYFVSEGMSAADAIVKIREMRPGSVETEDQELAIAEFSEWVNTEED